MTQVYIEHYWRDATPQDAIKEPPMVARFRNGEQHDWLIDYLSGIRCDHDYPWYSKRLGSRKHCQVYDAPYPGEGWRLVDVENEKPQVGDEWLDNNGAWKKRACGGVSGFNRCDTYRRRIDPPKPKYVPFTWQDREQLRGRWYTTTLSCGEIRECQIEFLRLDRNVFYIGSFTSEQLLEKNARFLDTGEPVGRRVE